MVLHNDKWVKKAKRAVERRKGIRHSASRGNSGQHEQSREPLEVGRIASRDRNETLSDSEDSQESGDSPIEFDFGDEGKTKEEMETLRASEGPGVTRAPAVAEQRRVIEKAKDSSASIQDTLPATVDKRYARRKLFDNSARYEEAVLDPYILAQEPVEEEPDYKQLQARHFTNPDEKELVPDVSTLQQTPILMDDAFNFDKLRQMQQKEEYARQLKQRFGQRRKVAPVEPNNLDDDDIFFEAIEVKGQSKRTSDTRFGTDTSKSLERKESTSENQRQLERYLDDLLKL